MEVVDNNFITNKIFNKGGTFQLETAYFKGISFQNILFQSGSHGRSKLYLIVYCYCLKLYPYPIETRLFVRRANKGTGFYMVVTSIQTVAIYYKV